MISENIQPVIFLTENNSAFRKFLNESFKEAEINVRIFSFNSEEKLMISLDQLNVFPDLIFLSFDIHNETAKACLKKIRLKNTFANVPIIIFSTFTYSGDINEAFENGANLFIPKYVFMRNSSGILQNIFSNNRRSDLMQRDKTKFVLNDLSGGEDKLSWAIV